MKKSNVTSGEIVLYVLFSVLALCGLALIVLGFIGNNMVDVDNALRNANKSFAETMKMTFEVLGTLVMLASAAIISIGLATNGKRVEVVEEKRARRAQRLQLEDDGSKENLE